VTVVYQYQPVWEDSRVILYREYFGCAPVTFVYIGRMQAQFRYTDDEMFVMLWVARLKRVSLDEVVMVYGSCNRSLAVLTTRYGITPAAYYVEVDRDADFSIRFRNLYITHYSRRYHAVQYSNDDIVALIQLRIAKDYYGIPPRDYFRYDCRGEDFRYVVTANIHWGGRGGYDCRGERVVIQPRPWSYRSHDEYITNHNQWMRGCARAN
jgi:hypothetical protein